MKKFELFSKLKELGWIYFTQPNSKYEKGGYEYFHNCKKYLLNIEEETDFEVLKIRIVEKDKVIFKGKPEFMTHIENLESFESNNNSIKDLDFVFYPNSNYPSLTRKIK